MINTALILAGGLGTRLRPLTDHLPKPLLPIKSKPILQHVIENLKSHGVEKIILSIGYKADQIEDYFKDGSWLGVKISYLLDGAEPLGTGGAIKKAAVGLDEPLFVIWGDNLTNVNYTELYQTYLNDKKTVTMVLTPREDIENFGVAKLDGSKILAFIEKPKREEAPSNLINAGAIILEPQSLVLLPDGKSSIEYDFYQKIAPQGEISAYVHRGQWFPTDTLEKYQFANDNFVPLINFSQKKIIVADVDDTICHSCQQITPEMAQQINLMIKRGYQFAFISGTKAEDLKKMISSRVTEEHHLLATTGTKYALMKNQQESVIYNQSFNADQKKEIFAAFEKLIAQFNIQSLTTKEDQLQDRDSQITLSAIGRHASTELKAQYDPDGQKRQEWIKFMQQDLGEKYDIKIGGTTSLDVTKKGLDKEWGIRKFAQQNNLALNQIIFFGDKIYLGGNDYPATKVVDCVSVKNPEETLQKLKELF